MKDESQRRTCEFQLLRYVSDAVRNEYVHIGVILREQGSQAPAQVQFTRDWRRVRCLDPEADTALLEGMESELRRRFQEEPEGKLMRLLNESLAKGACTPTEWAGGDPGEDAERVRARRGLGSAAQAHCGFGVYAAGRPFED